MLEGQPPTPDLMKMVQGLKQNRTTEEKLKVADKLQASPNFIGCGGDRWIIF
jgi:hypothetical protein